MLIMLAIYLHSFALYTKSYGFIVIVFSNVYIPLPWAQAGSKPSFFNMLLRRSRHASLLVPSVDLR